MARYSLLSSRIRLGAGLLALGVACALSVPARADDQSQGTPTLSEKTSEAFSRIAPLWEAKNWDGILAELNALIPNLDPNSYDMAIVQFNMAKILIQKDKLMDSIDPLTKALQIADTHPEYIGKDPPLGHDEVNQIMYLLGELYAQQASDTKDPEVQGPLYDKALAYFRRYLHSTTKPTEDVQYAYAALIYGKATADLKRVNKDLLHEAENEIHKGLLMSAKPKEQFYDLYVAALQQDDDLATAAKYTEVLVSKYPQKKEYWTNLWALYTNLASNQKDEAAARVYYARAINTFERAKVLGFLNTPKDNYNLITLYYNAGQFRRSTELLEAGLKSGAVPNDSKNWDLLAYAYQEINDYSGALHAYESEEESYPDDGNIDVKMAALHSQLDDTQAAYNDYARAVTKSKLDRPFEVYRQLAYNAYLLGEDKNDPKFYDEALKAMDTGAEKYPDLAASDKPWKQLHTAIQDTVTHLAQVKAAVEAQNQAR